MRIVPFFTKTLRIAVFTLNFRENILQCGGNHCTRFRVFYLETAMKEELYGVRRQLCEHAVVRFTIRHQK